MGDRGFELTHSLSSPPSWREHALSALLAIGGGWSWSLCFEAEERGWLAWVALAPLVMLLERRHSVRWALLFGVAYWSAALPWIVATLASFGGMPVGVARLIFVVLVCYLAIDIVLFAWIGRFLLRASPEWGWLGLPVLWVTTESLRGFFFDGFPWNLAAYAWIDVPGALELTSFLGATGLSFVVVATNSAIAMAGIRKRIWPSAGVVAGAVLLLVAGAHLPEPRLGSSSGTVRVVQPNSAIVFDSESAWRQYRQLIELSHASCDGDSLLVWPESAAWPESWQTSEMLRADVGALVERGCPVLLGSTLPAPDNAIHGTLNAAMVVTGQEMTGGQEGPELGDGFQVSTPYAKRHLVPWGEYVPLSGLSWVRKLARNAGDFIPGHDVALLPWRDEKLGVAICYEVMFAAPVAEQVQAGATSLVTITNDAWYGDSSAPHQHLRGARFRAAENRRPMVRAALTGISASIGPRGQLLSSLGVGEQGVLEINLRPGLDSTFYGRAPWWPLVVSWLASVWAIAFAIIKNRRRSRAS